jgi:glutamine phosphoribosylpyrophosphate amidotransferase
MGSAAEPVRYAAGFVVVLVAAAFAGGLVAWALKKLIEAIGLRPVDRTLGAAFGLARGVVLLHVRNHRRGQATHPVNQLIYDALLLLQHRGQDAAGIVTQQERKFFMHKAKGMVRDVFRTRNMRSLPGNCGLGQVRYPTAGNAFSEEEAQPFYVNAPFGIVLVHNGNLTNAHALKAELFNTDHRHINTESDSEVLLNVLAHEIERTTRGLPLQPADLFVAVRNVHQRVKGSYAVIALIAGHGVLAFP